MYAFFYSLYVALFTGNFQNRSWLQAYQESEGQMNKLINLIANTIGGNFAELQTFEVPSFSGTIATILAIITIIGICGVVWKLTKMVFSIFFSRA